MKKLSNEQLTQIDAIAEKLAATQSLREYQYDAVAWAYDLVLCYERELLDNPRREMAWFSAGPNSNQIAHRALAHALLHIAINETREEAAWRLETDKELEPYAEILLDEAALVDYQQHLHWLATAKRELILEFAQMLLNRGSPNEETIRRCRSKLRR